MYFPGKVTRGWRLAMQKGDTYVKQSLDNVKLKGESDLYHSRGVGVA